MNSRRFLTGIAVSGSACGASGCPEFTKSKIPVAIGVINNRGRMKTVDIEITRRVSTVFEQTTEVNPSSEDTDDGDSYWPVAIIHELIKEDVEYQLSVDTNRGDSTSTHVVAECTKDGKNPRMDDSASIWGWATGSR
ncbi:hypothetical protein [Natronosalvus rutilus]|uniref:Uncharacterized protein n=1 Tax=Natronosalvus rutilus TaxID=2953753 RepID=A0A9E7SVW1_9EURY|nr:hypothetical protein [Natronosalvus rutilus]UTF53396.1 hypothetical protein NGM29_16750 [Natronosalvus rutilus]